MWEAYDESASVIDRLNSVSAFCRGHFDRKGGKNKEGAKLERKLAKFLCARGDLDPLEKITEQDLVAARGAIAVFNPSRTRSLHTILVPGYYRVDYDRRYPSHACRQWMGEIPESGGAWRAFESHGRRQREQVENAKKEARLAEYKAEIAAYLADIPRREFLKQNSPENATGSKQFFRALVMAGSIK